jgi:hypothetical protein
MTERTISIWFFIGVLLAVYGAIILAAGIADWSEPGGVVLANLHVGVWWGGLMMAIGGVYTWAFAPKRKGSRETEDRSQKR